VGVASGRIAAACWATGVGVSGAKLSASMIATPATQNTNKPKKKAQPINAICLGDFFFAMTHTCSLDKYTNESAETCLPGACQILSFDILFKM
jgi:hypothetical protein